MRNDSHEIEIVAVDCFNDVTGINEANAKLWDVQSKNHASMPPSKIGESLLTLYDNYISNFEFEEYILFIPKAKREYLINPKLNFYKIQNLNDKTKSRVVKKLKSLLDAKYEESSHPLFNDFLNQITFVEDTIKISNYVKQITEFKNKEIKTEEFYISIFNEIRDRQSSLKNSYIENKTISKISDVRGLNRDISKIEIHTLLINRIVGAELFSDVTPNLRFLPVLRHLRYEEQKDLLQQCSANLCRAFFDKNSTRLFWKVSEYLLVSLRKDPERDIFKVHSKLKSKIHITTPYLTENTLLLMISRMMEGLENDN